MPHDQRNEDILFNKKINWMAAGNLPDKNVSDVSGIWDLNGISLVKTIIPSIQSILKGI